MEGSSSTACHRGGDTRAINPRVTGPWDPLMRLALEEHVPETPPFPSPLPSHPLNPPSPHPQKHPSPIASMANEAVMPAEPIQVAKSLAGHTITIIDSIRWQSQWGVL